MGALVSGSAVATAALAASADFMGDLQPVILIVMGVGLFMTVLVALRPIIRGGD